jgi:hypothetical protein
VDALTRRAERALLGAMIADPALARQVRVRPEEFAEACHGDWYRSIRAAGRVGRPVLDGRREAILAAGPSLAPADLDGLVADCPDPGHWLAYEAMVVQAWSRRFLQEAARRAGNRATDVGREARQVAVGDSRAGVSAATAADHMAKVATALQDHASRGRPQMREGMGPEQDSLSAERRWREELVLAGLLRPASQRAAAILRTVTATAFGDSYRRKVFQTASAMHQHGRPVDELTVDWELTMHGVPIAPGSRAWTAETYGKHLARIEVPSYDAPIDAAREVQALHDQAHGRPSIRSKVPGAPGPQRVRRDATASARQGQPRLRLIVRPPEGEGPGRGPEQR